jgi:hypothetical protein
MGAQGRPVPGRRAGRRRLTPRPAGAHPAHIPTALPVMKLRTVKAVRAELEARGSWQVDEIEVLAA